MKQTPLYDVHANLGARFIDFAGWSVPLTYGSILEEAKAVRSSAGLFDVSHMGRLVVQGPNSEAFLQKLTTNDISRLIVGRGHYTLMCNEHGGIIDDLIVFHVLDDSYLLVVNASNTETDLQWLRGNLQPGVSVADKTAETSLLALQGPKAADLLAAVSDDVPDLARFACGEVTIAAERMFVSRTGYTGEDGYEFMCSDEAVKAIWEALKAVGARACGLGARDVLRIEAGYVLYGQEIDENTGPVEAGLSRLVKTGKREFIGKEAISAVLKEGPDQRLSGIRMGDRSVPRHGSDILFAGQRIGMVTSGTFSPAIARGIGLGYVVADKLRVGLEVEVRIREKLYPARLAATPLYKLGETDDIS